MGVDINIKAYSSAEEESFKKHFSVVQFCIEMGVSFPQETYEFFKGAVCGENLEDFDATSSAGAESIVRCLKNGIKIDISKALKRDIYGGYALYPNKLPKHVDKIIIELS